MKRIYSLLERIFLSKESRELIECSKKNNCSFKYSSNGFGWCITRVDHDDEKK